MNLGHLQTERHEREFTAAAPAAHCPLREKALLARLEPDHDALTRHGAAYRERVTGSGERVSIDHQHP